jgi:uncharacterized membrane protein YfcA
MHFTWWAYPALFATGLVAGLVDAIAGGGGMVALPVLLNFGVPPQVALGTNKFQSVFGTLSAVRHYVQRGAVDLRACRTGVLATLLGSLAGAATVQAVDARALEKIIPWLLAAVFLYTLLRPTLGAQDHPPRMRAGWFFTGFGVVLGFYDGFFGPGVGSFWAIALIAVMGYNFTKATGWTKVMNATSNVASLGLFAAFGQVDYRAGGVMAVGQIIGGRLGAGLVVTRGARFVRPLFLVIVGLTLARLLYVVFLRDA